MKIVFFLFFIVGLQGCVKNIPPMADTSNAAKIIYTKISFGSGERQSLWIFDNPRFESTAESGRLIEHGNFARQSASVYVPIGERKYFKASYLLARPVPYGSYGSISECSAGVSFVPARDEIYVLTLQPSAAGCAIKLVDKDGNVPGSLKNLGVLE
ncbi:hypothetical protein D16iCDA_10070 [Pseudomonas seleniipraecipitans]|uniref:Lipoprotein n=1 Tax=Phytopseudomonas seleniipraecipitans TaxID=640205 RepID=A0ABY5JH29_9GAMM|nr:hypothetical protein [Pseudomonas seleniipraecipitans]UUD65963.1 hypothetical protein D16iCDA_10070 [Pseudomonas seleniipraecipitans]